MRLLTVASVEDARRALLACVQGRLPETETLAVPAAAGRILARDIFAEEDLPGFDRSMVDGYAVRAADTAGAGESLPVFLHLAGSVEMGEAAGFAIAPGECGYVPTGGMIPAGADAVVMVEYAEAFGGEHIALSEAASPGRGLVLAGEDIKKGGLLLRRGTRICAREAGALAALGFARVPVFKPIGLTLISTGDELVPPEGAPGPGQVRDVNSWLLKAAAEESGYAVEALRRLPDDEALLEEALREAKETSAVVIVSGGSSQGEKDAAAKVIARVSSPGVFVHGLALKPGKPVILAWDEGTGTILAGLPGHPVSALMAFKLLFAWLLRALTGSLEPFLLPVRMASNLPAAPGRTTLQPVSLRRDGEGYLAEPVFGKSGMIAALAGASGFVSIPMNTEGVKKGETLWVELF